MKRLIWRILFLIPLFMSHQPIQAQITGIKNFVNTNSGLCLAVRGATRTNGEEGTIWTCDGNADKNWNIIAATDGCYKIQNMNSNLFLAVGGGSRDYGGRVVQYVDQGQQDILWRFIDIGGGVYKIQNKNSGLVLAIGAGLREGGAPLVQWGDEGQEDIKWRLVPRNSNVKVYLTTGTGELRGGNNAYITINYSDGSSSPEYNLGGGFVQNSVNTVPVRVNRGVTSVSEISSIVIRHNGSPRAGHPFDTYGNWTLQAIRVALVMPNGTEQNVINLRGNPLVQYSGNVRVRTFNR